MQSRVPLGPGKFHVVVLVIKQLLKWQSPLYVSFVVFKKALDMVNRTVVWSILRYNGTPQEIVNIIKRLFEDIGCTFIYNANFSVPITVNTGVRQGSTFPVPTRLVVSNRLGDENNNGRAKRYSMDPPAEDGGLGFSNEINLLSHTRGDVARTTALEFNAMSQRPRPLG